MAESTTSQPESEEVEGFECDVCGEPMTRADFSEWKLQLPKAGEERQDYCDDHSFGTFGHWKCIMG